MPPPFASLPAVGFALTAEIWVSVSLSSVTVCPPRMPLAWGVPSKTPSAVAGGQNFPKEVSGQSAVEFQRFIGHAWLALNRLGGSICSGSGTRTRTLLPAVDFESTASTNSAIPPGTRILTSRTRGCLRQRNAFCYFCGSDDAGVGRFFIRAAGRADRPIPARDPW